MGIQKDISRVEDYDTMTAVAVKEAATVTFFLLVQSGNLYF